MKRCVILLALALVGPPPSMAQEYPMPTPAGEKALQDLVERCVAAGGLRRVEDAKSGASTLALGNLAKLKPAIEELRTALTPALRDTLTARCSKASGAHGAALISLLRVTGEVASDGRAGAFASFFEALHSREVDGRISLLEDAARRFGICEDRVWQASSYNQMGIIFREKALFARALEAHLKALEIRRAALGEGHLDVAASYNNIGLVYDNQGEYERALEAHYKSLQIRLATLGERHPRVAYSYDNIGVVYSKQGKDAKALEMFLKAREIYLATEGERHLDVALNANSIALVYVSRGEIAKALEMHLKALDTIRAVQGGRHPRVALMYNNIAADYRYQGEYEKALETHLKALEIRRAVLGSHTPTSPPAIAESPTSI